MADPSDGATGAPVPSQVPTAPYVHRVIAPDGSSVSVHDDPALAAEDAARLGDGHEVVAESIYEPTEVYDVIRSCGELVGRHASLDDAQRERDRLNREVQAGITSQGQHLCPTGPDRPLPHEPVKHEGRHVSYEIQTSRGVVLP